MRAVGAVVSQGHKVEQITYIMLTGKFQGCISANGFGDLVRINVVYQRNQRRGNQDKIILVCSNLCFI